MPLRSGVVYTCFVSTSPRYTKDEFARRGNDLYEREVQPRLKPEDDGKFVAIDIETGAFECDADEIAASKRLLTRQPEAQIWFRLVGSPHTRRFGPRSKSAA